MESISEEDKQMAAEMEAYLDGVSTDGATTPTELNNLGLETDIAQDPKIDPNLNHSNSFDPSQFDPTKCFQQPLSQQTDAFHSLHDDVQTAGHIDTDDFQVI